LGDPGQRTSHSIGPECSERRWNRHGEHPEDLCSLRPGDSVLDRLPRFAYFRSLTSSQLSYLILQVHWIQLSRRRKRTMVCSPPVPSQHIFLMLQSVFSLSRHFRILIPSDLRKTLVSRLDILLAVAPHDLQLKGLSQLNLSLLKSVTHNKQLFKIHQW